MIFHSLTPRSGYLPLGATVGSALLFWTGCLEPAHLEGSWTALGRPASAEIYTTTQRGASILMAEFAPAMERVEAVMSLERPDSEMNRVNREASRGFYRVENRDLYRCIGLALDYAKASEGAYDPTIGPVSRLYRNSWPTPPDSSQIAEALRLVDWTDVIMEREVFSLRFLSPTTSLDLAGMIEGYALDVAARKFVRTGSRAGLLRLGDHVYAWAHPPNEPAWSVKLTDPRNKDRPFVQLEVDNRALAVTGAGGDSPLVVDPGTGGPAASDVLVAVAIADSAADAGAISRAMLVGGSRRSGSLLAKTHRVEAVILVDASPQRYVLASASLQGQLEPSTDLAGEATGGVRYLLPPPKL